MNTLRKHIPFILFFGLLIPWLIPAYESTLISMSDHSQHMEYVWLIPVLSLFLLWVRRDQILETLKAPQPAILLSLPFFVVAAGLLFLGFRGEQTRFLQATAIFTLLGASLACYGKTFFKTVWFPILLLAFIMPVGFLDNFTVPLRRMSVSTTAFILNGLGVPVRQLGTAIVSASDTPFQLDVADPCSGIRSIVALFVGTAAYGAIALRRLWSRWVLFSLSIPIAFLGNILRLLLTALTSSVINQHAGMTLHDHALFIIAPIYTIIIFFATDALKRLEKAPSPPVDAPATPTAAPKPLAYILLFVLAIALNLFKCYAGNVPPLTFEADTFIAKTFAPLPNATMTFPWFCQNRTCLYQFFVQEASETPTACPQCTGEVRPVSKAELDILPNDTQCRKVTYTFNNGDSFTVALVVAGRSRMSIHRPELCLPSQGYVLSTRKILHLSEQLPMAAFSLRQKKASHTSGFAYVFLNSHTATVSNLERVLGDSWERTLHNRIPRWAMLTVRSPMHDFHTPEGEAALQRFMKQFYPTLFTEPRP